MARVQFELGKSSPDSILVHAVPGPDGLRGNKLILRGTLHSLRGGGSTNRTYCRRSTKHHRTRRRTFTNAGQLLRKLRARSIHSRPGSVISTFQGTRWRRELGRRHVQVHRLVN